MRLRLTPLELLYVPLLAAAVATKAEDGGTGVFNPADIMEDIHEAPRFRIRMLDDLIPDSKLDSVVSGIRSLASKSERGPAAQENEEQRQHSGAAAGQEADLDKEATEPGAAGSSSANATELIYDPIVARAGRKWRFMCQVPRVDSIKDARAMSDAAQSKQKSGDPQEEERQAIVRGLELLVPLKDNCITYVSGWWTFEYCHDKTVRQYHRMTPDQHGHIAEIEYRLGEHSHRRKYPALGPASSTDDTDYKTREASYKDSEATRTTQIRKIGRKRFLTQVWGGGTLCDITRQPREVEVQFHCDSNSYERIALVEEVATCQYVVVINTPRLCADPSFYDTNASTVYDIKCQQVVPDADYDALTAERMQMLRLAEDGGQQEDVQAEQNEKDLDMVGREHTVEDDDNIPLAMLGHNKQSVDTAMTGSTRSGKANEKTSSNSKPPQIVVSLNDPALAGAARQNRDMVRRLLALAYGDLNLEVEFSSDVEAADATKAHPAEHAGSLDKKAATRHTKDSKQQSTDAAHEEL
ncbi:Protein OS-9 [Coemansia guatemalensis]|uniref:Protein OS-9 homolog n=1 Tax=Coemansia guatemalensis TaxID=2761395 RepID=A0A9W8I385_9FUNG|nr:Protein OS-9 [Coemansia guatemalensis]